MRRAPAWWILALAFLAAACAVTDPGSFAPSGPPPAESAWVARSRRPSPLLVLVRDVPELDDLATYLRARDAARDGVVAGALDLLATLPERHPDSIWIPSAHLLAGRLRRRIGDLEGARAELVAARSVSQPGSDRWVAASLILATVEQELGHDEPAVALVRAVREKKPRGVVRERARRLVERIGASRPELFTSPSSRLTDGELALGEGDVVAATSAAESVLSTPASPAERAGALWLRCRAERASGRQADAEASCRAAAHADETIAPKALAATARWRWNADDDTAALRLYRELATRLPTSPEAIDARYAIGRIHQEAGRYDEAFDAFDWLAREHPDASLAGEAMWRAAWVRYLGGDLPGAAAAFAAIHDVPAGIRASAAYWDARIRQLLHEPDADVRLASVVAMHPTSYYAGLAAERLGHEETPAAGAIDAPAPQAFPDDLPGPHAERARALARLGVTRLARRELDAVGADAPPARLAAAYTAVHAPGAALLAARSAGTSTDPDLRRFLYPLGYWSVVEPTARARGLDPLLVAALIRQESQYFPDAVSPAEAYGLMQLLPRTARTVAADAQITAVDPRALRIVPTNVQLGTVLLRRLLDKYDGSIVKALAAYNAGEDAVAKWEHRYGVRPEDEFVELISYRETRDYVKLVLQHLRAYRDLYAPSAVAISLGSPPNAPFDMIATTSPGAVLATK